MFESDVTQGAYAISYEQQISDYRIELTVEGPNADRVAVLFNLARDLVKGRHQQTSSHDHTEG